MGYKNKTNKEYQYEYYAKNKVKRNQYHKDYYKENQEYIRAYQYFYYRNKKYEIERDLKKVYENPNNFNISLEE
jgi:hypothetical protein